MTEDPVKLYVVVMSILLCVLVFVAWSSWTDASAFEQAILDAPHDAKRFKEYAGRVQSLCDQLGTTKWQRGELSLIEDAARDNRLQWSRIQPQRDDRKRTYREKRWAFEFRKSGKAECLTREQIARLCRTVESYSRNILKTIEIQLFRQTEAGTPAPGKEERVVGDIWRGKLIFGMRVVE